MESPNWKKYSGVTGFVQAGFPFEEGFPPARLGLEAKFQIITRDGVWHVATVDYSTQYRAEGKQWRTLGGAMIYPHTVLCWKLIEG